MIYLTNGNVPLNEAYNDEIVQEHNNTYQLTFRFPTSDPKWELLKEETFLTADDLHGEQDFYIFEVEKQQGYIQVYANQVFSLLNNYVVNAINLDRETGASALSRFAGSITRQHPFSFFSDIWDRHTFNIDSKNAMEAFAKDKHSILGQWGGDLVRHGYQVRLLKNGGSENESLFMYKKNLSSYQHKTSTKSLRTRITFKTTIKGEEEKTPDKHYSVTIESPLINKYNQIYEDVVEVNDQDVKDEASLRKYGEQYFRTTLCDMMEDSLEIEVVGQSDVPVQMFDVVSIYHEGFGLDVRKKITKYTYSPMAKKLKSIGFGQFKSGLANAIGNMVSDALKNETQGLLGSVDAKISKELKNADLAFDRKKEELVNQFTDELNATRAKTEEIKRQISSEIDKKFQSFDNASIQEARRKAEEALRQSGANALLAQEAKRISDQAKSEIDNLRTSSQTAIEQIETFKTQYGTKLNEFKTTSDGILTKLGAIETYVNNDGQRQESLQQYARDESARQVSAVREQISQDYVGKSAYQEDVRGLERRFSAISTQTNNDIASKIAQYKQTVDGQFASITSQIAGKVNQTDFQRVRETSQLYERILGTSETDAPNKLSRLVMSSEIFQTEVGKYVTDDNNLVVNSQTLDKSTTKALKKGVSVVNNNGVFTIDINGLTSPYWGGFTLPIYVPKILKGEVYTLGFKYRVLRTLDADFCVTIKNHAKNKSILQKTVENASSPVNMEWTEFQGTFKMAEDFEFGKDTHHPLFFYLVKNGHVEIKEPMLVRGYKTGSFKPSQFDEAYRGIEATRTQVTQLAGSYAIRNLNSAGDLISGLNLGANGQNRITGKATHITGETLIDKAVIKSAMVDKLKTANFEAGSVTTTILDAEAVTADKVRMDQAFANKLVASNIFTDTLAAKEAFINKLRAVVVSATLLEGYKGWIGGFQLGNHDSGTGKWLTGKNQFSVGMGNGEGGPKTTALWVNWGNRWDKIGDRAWLVKNDGRMWCYNTAEFWNTPVIHGNLRVTGSIYYDNRSSGGKAGYWVSSPKYSHIEPSGGSLYLYYSGSGYDWIIMNKDVSDRRYKTNIEDSKISGLDIIQKLKTYSYRKEYDGTTTDISCGIMAQDVQKYIPEAFFENPDGAYSYRTFELVPYLIKAIQELAFENKTLTQRLENLESERRTV